MHFSKVGPFLSASRITGPKHNILQLEIGSGDGVRTAVERLGDAGAISLSEDGVVSAVMEGLAAANERFQQSWTITRLRYAPADSGPEATYAHLAFSILANLAAGRYEGVASASSSRSGSTT